MQSGTALQYGKSVRNLSEKSDEINFDHFVQSLSGKSLKALLMTLNGLAYDI